ncbi:MAG: precorrin-6y C5,15-methyltransferase (decarboxylating) subunit CbiE [Synergistaceae bacterium]|jgi:precorrin-6y C5,15-methyltransferase (decarboxylating) CbiE subunit|nr:precorrin-6y C5,15-methyltransferase (decarboxylating) subunit CbiE [Synergistaceae bacterium]
MIKIVGFGPGTREHITGEAVEALSSAGVVVAGKRILRAAVLMSSARMVELPPTGMADAVLGVLERELPYGEVVLAVSGDPGFYSLAKKVIAHFGRDNVTVIPGISSIQLLAARIGRSWVNVASETLHGRELPQRSALAGKLANSAALVILLGPAQDAIAHIKWVAEDETLSGLWAAVGWDLGLPNEFVFEAESLADIVRCPYVGELAMLWLEKP